MTPTARPRYGPGSGAVGLKTLSDRPRSPRRPACQEKCTSSCVSRAVRNGGAQDRCQTRSTSRARYLRGWRLLLRVPVRTWARAAGVAPASVAPRPRARPPRWPRPPLPRAPRRPPGAASGGAASSSSSSSSELLSDAAKELASSWSARSWSSWSSSSLELTTTAVAASPAWRRGRAADGAAAGTCVQLSVNRLVSMRQAQGHAGG